MSVFPLDQLPSVTWHQNPRNTHFGAPRSGGFPLHGACDLIVPAGTGVRAIQAGRIIRFYSFVTYSCADGATTTWAMDVAHERFMARYGEISPNLPAGIRVGMDVEEGQTIATVGIQCGGSMLHFELFDDPGRMSYLTEPDPKKYLYVAQGHYERRNDLLDPTFLLDRWSSETPASWAWKASSASG